MKINDFAQMKSEKKKISMITCYDYVTAKIIDKTEINSILVGDSVAMVMHGHHSTTAATIEMMATHIAAVSRGITKKFIVGDMPFLSYRKSLTDTMNNVQTLIQAGAHAVKLEGAAGNLDIIKHIVESGIPVMGHIGLTPQSVLALGGHKVQGKNQEAKKRLAEEARALEMAGCFAIVLECIPADLATEITQQLSIPTIGIGAGPDTDGQILVLHDMLGLQTEFKPKFLKHYLNSEELILHALNTYVHEVETQLYPADEHLY